MPHELSVPRVRSDTQEYARNSIRDLISVDLNLLLALEALLDYRNVTLVGGHERKSRRWTLSRHLPERFAAGSETASEATRKTSSTVNHRRPHVLGRDRFTESVQHNDDGSRR